MNTLSRKTRQFLSCIMLCSLISVPTYADCTICSVNQTIAAWGTNIQTSIEKIYSLLYTALNQNFGDLSYYASDVADNLTLGKQITPTGSAITSAVNQMNVNNGWIGVIGSIGPSSLLPNNNLAQSSIRFTLTSLIGGDTWDPALASSSGDAASYQADQSCGNNIMSFESLVSPLTYRTTQMSCDASSPSRTNRNQANYALNYLQLISDGIDPISNLTPATAFTTGTPSADNIKALINDKSMVYQNFMNLRRSWLAAWSAAYDNLFYLYTQHSIPVDANGNQIGNDSPIEISTRIATRRTSDPQWYSDIHGAASPVLQRETVFILAEIQRDINEMRRENQRLLALQAIQLAVQLKQAKQFIKPLEMSVRNKAQSILSASAQKEGSKKPVPTSLQNNYENSGSSTGFFNPPPSH